jgi:hypothetical protein
MLALSWPDAVFQSVPTVCLAAVVVTWLIGTAVLDVVDVLNPEEDRHAVDYD